MTNDKEGDDLVVSLSCVDKDIPRFRLAGH